MDKRKAVAIEAIVADGRIYFRKIFSDETLDVHPTEFRSAKHEGRYYYHAVRPDGRDVCEL